MTNMSFICDYAIIDPITLAYKVDCSARGVVFATYEDIDEDTFEIHVFAQEGEIPNKFVEKISNLIEPYLYVDPEIFED